mgnify:CR=1 FL=1
MFDDLIIFEPTFTLNGRLIIVMWMSGHPGNRRQWKAEMVTAATHLACVARSQSMGNGIPGLQKRKKENHENGSLLYVTYNQKGEGT